MQGNYVTGRCRQQDLEYLAVVRKARCAAYPVADERMGERVCLAIIGTIEPTALLAHLAAEGLSKYDMPEFFLRIDALPLTASGKILKRELVELTKRGLLRPIPTRFEAALVSHNRPDEMSDGGES